MTAAAAGVAMLILAGCSGSNKDEASIFVEIEAPTYAPVATLALTPTPTPVTLIPEANTPRPTRPPEPDPTPEPTPEPTPKPTEKPREEQQESSSGGSTPNSGSYETVSVPSASGKAGSFSSSTINGKGTVTDSVFGNGKITLVNYWSTT